MERDGLHSPYRNWKSGFVFEILLLLGVVLVLIAIALLAWLVFG